jgi:thiosulfate/3-mercaptopyruvate sulfurtransferase
MFYTVILIADVVVVVLFVVYQPVKNGQNNQYSSEGYANPQLLVEPDWVEQHKDEADAQIIDVRSKEQYDEGHIPGAANIDYKLFRTSSGDVTETISPEEFGKTVGAVGVTPATKVILYDSSDSLDATLSFWVFEYYGHKDVRILNGGFQRWVAQGRSVEEVNPQFQEAVYNVTVHEKRVASADWVLQHLNVSNVKVLDVRTIKEYTGKTRNSRRGGHIPSAGNVEWSTAMNPNGTFKSADKLTRMYRDAGLSPDKEVVVYCQTGHRAAHSYFVLRLLGYPRVRVYQRSWSEWGNRSDLPIER